MAGYSDYYQRTLDSAEHGVKLVLGPTGLGKTSSIVKVIQQNPGRKFVYIANRKQLLDEMAGSFSSKEHVVLRRDLEVVQQVLRTKRNDFDAFLIEPTFRNALHAAREVYGEKTFDVVSMRRAGQQLLEMIDPTRPIPEWLAEQADYQARIVLGAVRGAISVTRDKNEQSRDYNWLIKQPIVKELFPGIPFRRQPEIALLLLTLHKAYYGFFDGLRTRSFTDLFDDRHLVVFLDEFDFLEHDLVQLICRAPQIDDPFDFTRHFYQAMVQHKLPKEDYPVSQPIRDRILKVKEIIDGIQQRGIHYPRVNQFTWQKLPTQGKERRSTPAVFRTRHAISTEPLFIHQTERAFQLERQRHNPSWVNAEWFFNAVGTAATRILALFKELKRDDEVRYRELMRQSFRNTVFIEQVERIAHFPSRHAGQMTQRGTLLDSGYSVFDIDELQQRSDDEEVDVHHYQMLQTPENLLRSLAESFLVFGLSATADLPRSIHHFDTGWLEGEGILIPTTAEDEADIAALSAQKAMQRDNRMAVAQIDGLSASDPLHQRLATFLEAVAHDEEFGEDTRGGHRSQRMHRFWAAAFWLLAHDHEQARMLLFLNTFRQVRQLFTTFARAASEAGVYQVVPLPDTFWFDAYTVTIAQRSLRVVFFNAALAAQTRQSRAAEDAFNQLFWSDEPVIVVTQYLSAGNGVNLQYTNNEAEELQNYKRDFTHIGLLESPYYFFTKPDQEMSPDEILAARKANIWYLAKLFVTRQISEEQFRQILGMLNRPSEWNQRYRQGSASNDWLLNQMAIFIQALGRVERVWHKTSDQTALLAPDVFTTFQAFLNPDFDSLRERHAPFESTNLHFVLEDIARQTTQFERDARRQRDGRLREQNERSRLAIGALVERLEQVRQGQHYQARRDWEALRRAVLEHDFHAEIVKKYHAMMRSAYLSRGKLNLTDAMEILPWGLPVPGSRIISLDAVYALIRDNLTVREHFLDRGYDLRFDHPGNEFFTPYCQQAILAGAIGEEAITALLKYEQIAVEGLPDVIFEIADLVIAGQPWFIDAKNYNDLTLDRFTVDEADPLWHPKLNERQFVGHAQAKWSRLSRHAGPETKLIYINLATGQDRLLGYYDQTFEEVADFATARIIVVQGALDRDAPNRFHDAFRTFLSDLSHALNEAKGFSTEDEQ